MDPTPPPAKSSTGRIRQHPSRGSIPTWTLRDFPTFEACGELVHVVAVDGRQLLIERELAARLGRCGLPVEEAPDPMSRVDLAVSWLVFFMLGATLAFGMCKGWPW